MIDYKELNQQLRTYWETILITHTPGGKVHGKEYIASNINGGSGKSFSFNLQSGKWADFSTSQKGGDIISLYAEIYSTSQSDAAIKLKEAYLGQPVKHSYPVKIDKESPNIIKPPENAGAPEHPMMKKYPMTGMWTYKDVDSKPLFYIFRQDPPGQTKKIVRPLSYTDDAQWVSKHWPAPRPLYNLDKIYSEKDKPILIVEGEKTASAAEKMCPNYTVTTWPMGSGNVKYVDLSPLEGRKVLLWPDADKEGLEAMDFIIGKMSHKTEEIKIIYPDRNSGWDAADALEDGWDYKTFKAWAQPLIKKIEPYKEVVPTEILDPIVPNANKNHSHQPDGEMEANVSSRMRSMYIELGLDMDENKTKLLQTSINVERVLTRHPIFKEKIWYDEFYDRSYIELNGKVEAISDTTYLNLFSLFQDKFKFLKLSKTTLENGVEQAALKTVKNEPKDWVNSIQWDQTPRVEEFFIRAMGSEDNDYTRKVSQNFFVAQVARILDPGCKFDNMIILEGGQGIGKSRVLDVLAGKWFVEAPSNMDNKDFEQTLLGRTLVEFGELDQFRKSENTLIKKKLSCRIDNYRASHAKKNKDYPRTCIFVGTTNKDDYLQDETGARRFWPVKTTVVDMDYIEQNRDQFYAEARELYKTGFEYYTVPETAKDEQEARRFNHPWEDIINSWLNQPDNITSSQFTSAQIWDGALMGNVDRLDQRVSNTIAKAMKAIGWTQRQFYINKRAKRLWIKPGYLGMDLESNPIKPKPPITNYALQRINMDEKEY